MDSKSKPMVQPCLDDLVEASHSFNRLREVKITHNVLLLTNNVSRICIMRAGKGMSFFFWITKNVFFFWWLRSFFWQCGFLLFSCWLPPFFLTCARGRVVAFVVIFAWAVFNSPLITKDCKPHATLFTPFWSVSLACYCIFTIAIQTHMAWYLHAVITVYTPKIFFSLNNGFLFISH